MTMTKQLLCALVVIAAVASCNKLDLQYDESAKNTKDEKAINDNAKTIFGDIDPKQNWNSITSGNVNVTANADLKNIVKVQILTESPFMNPEAKVLSEATVTSGQTVNLKFDTPNCYTRLIAACVDKDGVYYIKGFNVGDQDVSFTSGTSRAANRAPKYNLPDLSNFTLEVANSSPSVGAMRTIRANEGFTINKIDIWENKGWENERLWRLSPKDVSGDWTINTLKYGDKLADGIRRPIEGGITEEEKTELQDIFNNILYDDHSKKVRKNNIPLIRESAIFNLLDNNLVSTGEPITIIPVQTFSTEINRCQLYYYYFNPEDIKNLSSEQQAQYLKNLPKFRAMQCNEVIGTTDVEFFRNYEYLLPYYGDGDLVEKEVLSDFTTDGKLYRIKSNYTEKGTYYITYENNENNRLREYMDDDATDLSYQLWQIFEGPDNQRYLYNIGIRAFLYYKDTKRGNSMEWSPFFTPDNFLTPEATSFTWENNHFWRTTYKGTYCLGNDLDKIGSNGQHCGIWTDKGNTDQHTWTIEEYTGSKHFATLDKLERATTNTITAKSYSIPQGYRVGFMLRKTNKDESWWKNHYYQWANTYAWDHKEYGECYGDGRLNTEINVFPGHFASGQGENAMAPNDPRIALFVANQKTYMCFEDGSDSNYNDMIIEINNGVELVNDEIDPEPEAYTMCFEDRPASADYDMNDIVLRCVRTSETTLELSLIACGAADDVVIHGATGWQYNDQEAHAIFNVPTDATGTARFVNTIRGAATRPAVTGTVTVDKNTSIPDYMKNIFIENKTKDIVITLAKQGEPPYAIIVPIEFDYPIEYQSIIYAYPKFAEWATDANTSKDWYLYPESEKIYPNPFNTNE